MARKMLDDSYEFVVNWDDGNISIQVEFVESTVLSNDTVVLTQRQLDQLKACCKPPVK